MTEEPALRLADVRAGYAGSAVLFGIDVTVAPGEVVALLGRNGVGKSTTVGVIAGTLRATAGSVSLNGRDVSRATPSARYAAGLRVVRQDQPTFGDLTVAENLRLVGCADPARAAEVFGALSGRERQLAGTLSGGEQKLLALARTAVAPGRCWILDEPTEGLQSANIDHCGELISDAAFRGVAVLLVEQHLDMALRVASRWYLLERGLVIDGGPVTADTHDAVSRRLSI